MRISDKCIAKVIEIDTQRAIVKILSINDNQVKIPFEAIIKREHMGLYNIDRIKVEDKIIPGDFILAQVKSLSETKKILLTIEEPELGVIFSKGENNSLLIPINQN